MIWTVAGPSEEFIASPAYSERAGLIFASSSYPTRELFAIKPDGHGDVTKTHIAWRDKLGSPYISSALIVGDWMLSLNSSGIAYCYEAAIGKVLWKGAARPASLLAGPRRGIGLFHQRQR